MEDIAREHRMNMVDAALAANVCRLLVRAVRRSSPRPFTLPDVSHGSSAKPGESRPSAEPEFFWDAITVATSSRVLLEQMDAILAQLWRTPAGRSEPSAAS